MTLRDCVFLVADKNMEAFVEGFLTREHFWESIGCRRFKFDKEFDLVGPVPGADPGVYARAHEFLRSFWRTHRHGVVLLDAEFSGSPGAESLRQEITGNLVSTGWREGDVMVIAIEPELESWLWARSPHLARQLEFGSYAEMRRWLMSHGDRTEPDPLWRGGNPKPHRPKEALERALDRIRRQRTSALFRRFAGTASPRGCHDPRFRDLVQALQRWFPAQGPGSLR